MKFDVDAAAGDVTGSAVADAARYADELCFKAAAKQEPELDASASQSQCRPVPVFCVNVYYIVTL